MSSTMAANSATHDDVINVFRIPHSRMKELVESHLKQVNKITNFSSSALADEIDLILEAVYQAMWELKSHEYIENHFIMDRLKARLQARKVYNQLVCNCHEDSKLLGVIRLVEKVYNANSETERDEYGHALQDAIKEFLKEFLHHMDEEEKVFQPLLSENFEVKELRDMHDVVLKQHSLFREKVKTEKSLTTTKRKREDDVFDEFQFSIEELRFRKSYCQEVEEHCGGEAKNADGAGAESSSGCPMPKKRAVARDPKEVMVLNNNLEVTTGTPTEGKKWMLNITELPEDVILNIFVYLSPKDLLRCAVVCRDWNIFALKPRLWKKIQPTKWASNVWTFGNDSQWSADYDDIKSGFAQFSSSNESLNSLDSDSSHFKEIPSKHYSDHQIFNGVLKHLLPKVGNSVIELNLSGSVTLLNSQVNSMLKSCPNIKTLDLSYTKINHKAFKDWRATKIEVLTLEGCHLVDDRVLESLEKCFTRRKKGCKRSKLKKLNLSGCKKVTSVGIAMLQIHQKTLEHLDLSGCYMLDGQTLCDFVFGCPKMQPDFLFYCNDIEDGPYPDEANGCSNLECSSRFCCQQLKN